MGLRIVRVGGKRLLGQHGRRRRRLLRRGSGRSCWRRFILRLGYRTRCDSAGSRQRARCPRRPVPALARGLLWRRHGGHYRDAHRDYHWRVAGGLHVGLHPRVCQSEVSCNYSDGDLQHESVLGGESAGQQRHGGKFADRGRCGSLGRQHSAVRERSDLQRHQRGQHVLLPRVRPERGGIRLRCRQEFHDTAQRRAVLHLRQSR